IFAFGLLGSYAITSVSLDVLKWREKKINVSFIAGVIASIALIVPWVTSWFTKPIAFAYGAAVTGLQLGVAFVTHRGWIRSGRFGYLRAGAAEEAGSRHPNAQEVLTLADAVALRQTVPSTTLLALRGPNVNLC